MPQTGHFILHSNVISTLTAGKYELVTEQTLPTGQTGNEIDVVPEHTHIYVASPRYTMPTDQILSTFPPANAEGNFGERLPQIVLKRRTLPWERNPEEKPETSTTPWLALVVVAEGEGQLSTATPVDKCVTSGTVLLDPDDKDVEQGLYLAVTETVVKKIFPCKDDLELLVHVREVDINDTELANGDDDGWLAVVLTNRLPVFDEVNKKPVRYMACLVNLEGQLDALPPPEPPQNHFVFELAQDWTVLAGIDPKVGPDARVMGGIDLGNIAVPHAAQPNLAQPHPGAPAAPQAAKATTGSPIVGAALDGSAGMKEKSIAKQWSSATEKVAAAARDPDAKRLVRDTMASGFRFPIELFALEKVLRFPVLAHWSFTTAGDDNFESLMRKLDVSLLGSITKADATAVPPPDPQAPKKEDPPPLPPPEVMETGHIGLDLRSRRGDSGRAWYRGPCVPFPTLRDVAQNGVLPLAHAADQLRRVVPDGREDLSLASAFEIGRLLALSQLSVVSALMRFRNEQFGAGRVRELLAELMAFEIPKLLDQRIDFGRYVSFQMAGNLVSNPERMIGPRRPVADPGRELDIKGDLDAVIAAGLGMDLNALRKTGDQIGMLAAVAQTGVPLANKKGTIEFDNQAISGLHAALFQELGHALQVAAPAPVLRSPAKRGAKAARAAAPAADALDELIARASTQTDEEEQP
jgi:hypothetical protein